MVAVAYASRYGRQDGEVGLVETGWVLAQQGDKKFKPQYWRDVEKEKSGFLKQMIKSFLRIDTLLSLIWIRY